MHHRCNLVLLLALFVSVGLIGYSYRSHKADKRTLVQHTSVAPSEAIGGGIASTGSNSSVAAIDSGPYKIEIVSFGKEDKEDKEATVPALNEDLVLNEPVIRHLTLSDEEILAVQSGVDTFVSEMSNLACAYVKPLDEPQLFQIDPFPGGVEIYEKLGETIGGVLDDKRKAALMAALVPERYFGNLGRRQVQISFNSDSLKASVVERDPSDPTNVLFQRQYSFEHVKKQYGIPFEEDSDHR